MTNFADTLLNRLGLIVVEFSVAAKNKAYPEINLSEIIAVAKETKCCPLVPETDEAAFMSWAEINADQAAEHMIRSIFASTPEDAITSDDEWDMIHRSLISSANAVIPAYIRKIGLQEIAPLVPDKLFSDESLDLLNKNGWSILESVARRAKELKASPSLSPR